MFDIEKDCLVRQRFLLSTLLSRDHTVRDFFVQYEHPHLLQGQSLS